MTLGMFGQPAHAEPRPSVPGSKKAESDVSPQHFSIASKSSSESWDPAGPLKRRSIARDHQAADSHHSP